MSAGKILNSLASASMAPTLSLMQVNFDFTFHKDVAPLEYRSIGQALSNRRRLNAEGGPAHRTARKLGWLFSQVVPDTPKLLKAYGQRVSEILQMPGVNPIGSEADGPFRDYVGADCTSLWAAATSGVPSLGVHLLACMLARDWDGPQATAIWVELIERRSFEILKNLQENHNVSVESITAARQDFSRQELGEWDMSVRSWLGQADKALEKERDQFLLIAKNVSLSIGNNKDPYTNIIPAWTQAMVAIETHLNGISQDISDGAVLKAISAWHLYPDLVHFGRGANQISFSDHLFTKPARMTLGLTEVACPRESRGIHWSLALSHLRYYGDPVSVESVEDRSRATLSQFQIILLGSVLESWRVRSHEQQDAMQWIHELWQYLKKTAPPEPFDLALSGHTSWLAVLAEASDLFLSATGSDLERYKDYLNHGESWGSGFLIDERQSDDLQPYFGLCNPMVMSSLGEPVDVDAGIQFLRQLAKSLGLKAQDAIICYSDRKSYRAYYEYCTAVPHLNSQGQEIHARWIKTSTATKPMSAELGRICHHKCHNRNEHAVSNCEIDLGCRSEMIESKGEACFVLDEGSLHDRTISVPKTGKRVQRLFWERPVPLYQNGNFASTSPCLGHSRCNCLKPPESSSDPPHASNISDVTFDIYVETWTPQAGGLPDSFQLYIRTTLTRFQISQLDAGLLEAVRLDVEPSHGVRWLRSDNPQPNRIWDYVQSLVLPNTRTSPQLIMEESVQTPNGLDWHFSHGRAANLITTLIKPPLPYWIRSLELMNVAFQIYRGLPGATINLGLLNYPISDAEWTALRKSDSSIYSKNVPSFRGRDERFGAGDIMKLMGRQEIFSCIALMETGVSNIRPEELKEVIAMSSGNSIFVAGTLLSDPYEPIPAKNIRHIVGNVGYTGLNLMVIPPGPLTIRQPANEVQKSSRRSNFEAERKNKFLSTSLHLSFTGQRSPLLLTDIDTIDQGIFFLQSVVSLWDDGKHLADLDILSIEKEDQITRIHLNCSCPVPQLLPEDNDIRCLDSWQDVFLQPRRRTSIVRAHGNWAVRLAVVSLLLQQQKEHVLGILSSETLCWRCLEAQFNDPEPHLPQILID
jgi:hypothetical protein